jgi:pSer/pThr/pTyr-binding forkhead associated (FHA) protein
MGYLYHMHGDGTPLESWLVPDQPLVVGRGESAQVAIQDNSLSRCHFMIVREAGQFFAVDLESQNGTWVDGAKIQGQSLRDGAVIRAGQSPFYFSLNRLPPHSRPLASFLPPFSAEVPTARIRAS